MSSASQASQTFLQDFEGRRVVDPAWLGQARRAGIERFGRLGLPTVKNEDWKYTNIGSLGATSFAAVERSEVDTSRFRDPAGGAYLSGDLFEALVFIDGHFMPELSRYPSGGGLVVSSLADALREGAELVEPHLGAMLSEQSAFGALNTAFVDDGAFIYLPAGDELAAPLELVFCSTDHGRPTASHPRVIIVAEEGSRGAVIERYVGQGDYLTNAITEIRLGPDSELHHCRLQREGPRAFHMARIEVRQAAGSRLRSQAVAMGGALSRTEIRTVLEGSGAEAELGGLYALSGVAHADHHTTIDHAAADARSSELYKGILDGNSRGVFTGRIIVREGSSGTVALQTNRNLLLSDTAVVDTRPQLEIYNDDVRCNHGATVGRLDQDALFYLQARGIPRDRARGLLTYAFASEVLERLGDLPVRREIEGAVSSLVGAPSTAELQ